MDLNLRAAARLLCTTEDEVFRLVEGGDLPHQFVQDQPRFNRVDLLEYATRRRMRVAADLFEGNHAGANGKRLRLSRLLGTGGIHRDLPGGTAAALLGALTRAIRLPEGVDRDAVSAVVEARGGLNPVGHGLALPHSRAPVAVSSHDPMLALGFPERPIACGAPDGLPVHAAFLIVSPSIRVHLDVLSKLGTALLDPELQRVLAARPGDDQVLGRLRQLEAAEARSP